MLIYYQTPLSHAFAPGIHPPDERLRHDDGVHVLNPEGLLEVADFTKLLLIASPTSAGSDI